MKPKTNRKKIIKRINQLKTNKIAKSLTISIRGQGEGVKKATIYQYWEWIRAHHYRSL